MAIVEQFQTFGTEQPDAAVVLPGTNGNRALDERISMLRARIALGGLGYRLGSDVNLSQRGEILVVTPCKALNEYEKQNIDRVLKGDGHQSVEWAGAGE
jgi:hypothetical protein